MIAALCTFLFLAAVQEPEPQAAPPSPRMEEVFFPLSDSYRPGRWFSYGLVLKSDKEWSGWAWLVLKSGEKFSRWVELEAGKEKTVVIPVFFGKNLRELHLSLGSLEKELPLPFTFSHHALALVGSEDETLKRIENWKTGADLPWNSTTTETARTLHPQNLPQDLYILDGLDFIWIEEGAVDLLAAESVETLRRWAVQRGRVLTTREGKRRFEERFGEWPQMEVQEAPHRSDPVAGLPPMPDPPLTPKDFATWRDPASLALFLYLGASVLLVIRSRWKYSLSLLVLAGGIASFLEVMWGVGWPARNYPWQAWVVWEGQDEALVEEHFAGPTKSPLYLRPNEYLILPELNDRLVVDFGAETRFLKMGKNNRGYSAASLGGRKLALGAGQTIRNNFEDLREVCWVIQPVSFISFRPRFAFGEVIGIQEGQVPPPKSYPRRPLSDFLRGRWVTGQWIMARFSPGAISFVSRNPLKPDPKEAVLLWHPRTN